MIVALGERVEQLEDKADTSERKWNQLMDVVDILKARCNHKESGVVQLEEFRTDGHLVGYHVVRNRHLIQRCPGDDGLSGLPGVQYHPVAGGSRAVEDKVVPADQAADLLAGDVPPPYVLDLDIPM